jgi:hypothetical protein
VRLKWRKKAPCKLREVLFCASVEFTLNKLSLKSCLLSKKTQKSSFKPDAIYVSAMAKSVQSGVDR